MEQRGASSLSDDSQGPLAIFVAARSAASAAASASKSTGTRVITLPCLEDFVACSRAAQSITRCPKLGFCPIPPPPFDQGRTGSTKSAFERAAAWCRWFCRHPTRLGSDRRVEARVGHHPFHGHGWPRRREGRRTDPLPSRSRCSTMTVPWWFRCPHAECQLRVSRRAPAHDRRWVVGEWRLAMKSGAADRIPHVRRTSAAKQPRFAKWMCK